MIHSQSPLFFEKEPSIKHVIEHMNDILNESGCNCKFLCARVPLRLIPQYLGSNPQPMLCIRLDFQGIVSPMPMDHIFAQSNSQNVRSELPARALENRYLDWAL